MRRCCLFVVFVALLCSGPVCAQEYAKTDQLFSPSVAQKFYEIAYELANSTQTNQQQADQAITFFMATMQLDSRAKYALADMIDVASRSPETDYSQLVYQLLVSYVNESSDMEVTRKAIRYLLERLDSREEREEALEGALQQFRGKNKALESELATLIGLLKVEKADMESAPMYFMNAYGNNRYNKLAFEKLAELAPENIEPAIQAERLRLALTENPLNIEAALEFAAYTEQLQLYGAAADAYEYCADLFRHLYPSQQLPVSIYRSWIICYYNTQRSQHKCLQIAERLRKQGIFDLFIEAIAAKAAERLGNKKQAEKIFGNAVTRALQLIDTNNSAKNTLPGQIAWFYSFAMPNAEEALDWANKAYSTDTNSPAAASMLAYALALNDQSTWAKTLIDNYERNQISDLVIAMIQLKNEKRAEALETLKSVIEKDPASLAAQKAKKLMLQNGSEYITPAEPDIILMSLTSIFGADVVPNFVTPDKIFSVQFNLKGSKFSYGSDLSASVAITNNYSQPLIVSDDGLFSGNIRIDAEISGDINKKIPNLISTRVRPALPLEPGRSLLIPIKLKTAQLKQILDTYPQASLNLKFTVYVDPVTTGENTISNKLLSIKPFEIIVKRPGVKITSKYLQNRMNSLSKGRQGQKIKTIQLFIGLLTEQQAMANKEPLYKFMYADWMPPMLKSAILHSLSSDDWVEKTYTMANMISLPMDYEMTDAIGKNLSDTHWPTRLIAVYMLAKSQSKNFKKVLDWTAKYDPNMLVRQMAIALGAVDPSKEVQDPQNTGESINQSQ